MPILVVLNTFATLKKQLRIHIDTTTNVASVNKSGLLLSDLLIAQEELLLHTLIEICLNRTEVIPVLV